MHLRSSVRPLATVIAAAVFSATASAQTSGTWTNLAGGSWGLDTNWQALAIADGQDALADFSTLNLTANATVTLDGARLVGGLKFGDATTASHDWIVDTGTGGPLTLDVATGAASINVVNRVATINAAIAGTDGIDVTGAGTLVLNGVNTFTGQLHVASGTSLQVGAVGAFGATGVGNETIVANGGVLRVATVGGTGINYGPELIRVGGTGLGNTGAVFGAGGATSTLQNITLTDHTSFGGTARFNISGGTLNLNGFKLTKVGTNQIAVPGGTVTDGDIDITAGNLSFEAGAAVKGTGTITVSSGAILGLWSNTAGQQTRQVALNGGAILRELGSTNANSTFSSPIRLQGNVTVDVLNAATHLKLPGGISESGGSFGFTRTGPGSLTLGGTNSFTGAVNLNTSTTFLGAGATLTASAINVASGAVFDVTPAGGYTMGSGQTLAAGRTGAPANDVIGAITAATGSTIEPGGTAVRTLSFANDLSLAGTTLIYDLGSTHTAGAGVNDLIAVTGDLALSGTNFITPRTSGAPPVEGTYTLLTYTGAIATGDASNFAVSLPPMTRQNMAVDTTTPNAVLLQVTGAAASLTWVGDDVNNVWNLDGAANFTDGFAPQEFLNLDTVTFADGGSSAPAVNVTGTLQPAAVLVNATQAYTFGGTGVLSGTMPLTKSGTGTLTINGTAHDFSGGVTINGGTVSVGTINPAGEAGPLGTGPLTLAGGTLEYNGVTGSTNRVLTLGTDGGAIRVANAATVLTMTASPTGATPFVKSGPGVLLANFTGAQTGGTVVAEGTLRLANTNALGAAGSAVTVADGATLDVNGLTPVNKVVLTISGSGVGGLGALRNSGAGVVNNNIASTINLAADASIGTNSRYDFVGAVAVNGGTFTLTKVGTGETWWAPSAGATIGDIVVAGGRLGVQSSNNLGSTSHSIIVAAGAQVSSYNAVTNAKPIVLSGGSLHNNSAGGVAGTAGIWNGSLTLQGTGITNKIDTFGGPIVLNGKITGPGGFEKLSTGGTAYGLDVSSAENDYLGDTQITRGTVRIVGAGVISPSSALVMNGAAATFDGANTAQTVAGLRGTAGVVTNVGLTVNNSGSDVFSGDLTGAGTSLVKAGAGTLTLASLTGNTYAGPTTVNAGTLLVTGAVTGSAATVNGGILGGTGTTGALTLNDGSVAPGVAGIGTLNAASFLWNGGELRFELGAANSSDRLSLSAGVFDKGTGGSFVFDFLGTGQPDSIYTLANFGSTDFASSDFSFINLALGDGGGTFQMDGSTLQFVTVPEPGSAVILLAGLSTLLGTRRRRQQSLSA